MDEYQTEQFQEDLIDFIQATEHYEGRQPTFEEVCDHFSLSDNQYRNNEKFHLASFLYEKKH